MKNHICCNCKKDVGHNPLVAPNCYNMDYVCDDCYDVFSALSDELDSKGLVLSSYELVEYIKEKNKVVGRPSIGVTKKVSITLPEEVWSMIEGHSKDSSRSAVLRDILINCYEGDLEWFKKVFGQLN